MLVYSELDVVYEANVEWFAGTICLYVASVFVNIFFLLCPGIH